MRLHPIARAAACAFVVAFAPAQALAQNRPTLKPGDYGKWENLGSATLAPDGRWMAYSITRTSDENELRIREVAGDTAIVVPFGTQVAFSNDSRWAAYTIGHSEKERKAMEKANKPVRSRLALMDLKSRAVTYVDDISSFAFSDDARWVVMRGYSIKDRKSKGIDIVVRDLATGRGTNFGNVSEFAWQDGGPLLALAVDAEGKTGNGVQLYDPSTGVLRTLDSDTATYTGLSWRKDSDDLAALKVRENADFDGATHVVFAWKGLGG
jgi:protease II